jgi:cytosine deaminase
LNIVNARLRNREEGLYDIEIDGNRIIKVSKASGKSSTRRGDDIDARGRLVIPPLINLHFHLDTTMSLNSIRPNESGTLLEGIEIWAERKKKITIEDVMARAERAIKLMVAHGTTFLRTHADVTDPSLTTLKGVLKAKEEFKDLIEINTTAFPQDGIMTREENKELLEKAMENGADNVGIIPHNEFTREDGVKSIEFAFELAKKYGGKDIDGHVDETDDEQSRFLEVVAAKTIRESYQGKVTAGHTTAMHSYNNAYASKLFRMLKLAQITVIANPLINIHLQGRFDTYPKRRGMTRVKELLDYGVNVALGHDDLMDPWYPLGRGDMLQVLLMGLHVGHMMGRKDLENSLDLITTNAAKALRITKRYGIEAGKNADLVILDAKSELEVLGNPLPPRYVIKNGKIIVEREPYATKIGHKGEEETFEDFSELFFPKS